MLCGISYSQNWEAISAEVFQKVLEDCGKQYKGENYTLDFSRTIYMNPSDQSPVSASSGKLIRGKGKEYRLEAENQLTIQNKEVKMVIDSTEKAILLMKPDTLFDNLNPQGLFSGQDFLSCHFFYQKKGKTDEYKIVYEPETSSYQYTILSLDNKSKALIRLEFRMVASNYSSDELEDMTTEEPMMIVEYKPLVALKGGMNYFDLSPWIKLQGDKYDLLPNIEFTLDDLRIQE